MIEWYHRVRKTEKGSDLSGTESNDRTKRHGTIVRLNSGGGGGGGGVLGAGGRSGSKRRSLVAAVEAKLAFELLGDTVHLSVALARVEQVGLVNRLEAVGEAATTRKELVLGHGLVLSRLVNDGCLVGDHMRGDHRLDAVVLVRVFLNHRLHNIVDVVVDVLLDVLTLVDHLAVQRSLDVLVGMLAGHCSEQLSVLVGGSVRLFNTRHGVDLGVHLFGRVLRVNNGLDVVLNVVDVALVLALPSHFLNLVTLVCLVRNSSEVLDILVHLAAAQVEVLAAAHIMAVLVSDAAVGSVNIARSAKTVLDLVFDLLDGGALASSGFGTVGVVETKTVGASGGVGLGALLAAVEDVARLGVVVVTDSCTGTSGTNRADLLLTLSGRARVRGGGGRRRETAVIRRFVARVRLTAGKNLLNGVHVEYFVALAMY